MHTVAAIWGGGTTAHFPAVFAGTKDGRWSVGYERLPRGATTLNGCVKAVCTPSRVYGTFYKVNFFTRSGTAGGVERALKETCRVEAFDFRAATKIAKLFAVVHSQFCACAQKKSCRGPLGCSDVHTHRALPPEAAWAAVRTPNAKAVKSNLLAARVATPYYISTPWSLQRDVK